MGLGLSLLRLSPDAFWSLSPREFFAALTVLGGGGGLVVPPTRAGLDEMMARYPDTSPDISQMRANHV